MARESWERCNSSTVRAFETSRSIWSGCQWRRFDFETVVGGCELRWYLVDSVSVGEGETKGLSGSSRRQGRGVGRTALA